MLPRGAAEGIKGIMGKACHGVQWGSLGVLQIKLTHTSQPKMHTTWQAGNKTPLQQTAWVVCPGECLAQPNIRTTVYWVNGSPVQVPESMRSLLFKKPRSGKQLKQQHHTQNTLSRNKHCSTEQGNGQWQNAIVQRGRYTGITNIELNSIYL